MKVIIQRILRSNVQAPSTAAAHFAVAVLLGLILLAPTLALGAEGHHDLAPTNGTADEVNEYCPVLPDEPINPDISVEYEGRTIYFCCLGCVRDFREDPEQYIAVLESMDHQVEDAAPVASGHHEGDAAQDHQVEDESHDHATDHADSPGKSLGLVELAGRLHPLAVHFPIGLLIFAACLELIGLLKPREILRQGARLAVVGGAIAAIGAAMLGWAAGFGASYPGQLETLTFHRWLGTTVAVLSVAVLILSELAIRKKASLRPLYLALLFIGSVLIGIVGHLGATLVYGQDYLPF